MREMMLWDVVARVWPKIVKHLEANMIRYTFIDFNASGDFGL